MVDIIAKFTNIFVRMINFVIAICVDIFSNPKSSTFKVSGLQEAAVFKKTVIYSQVILKIKAFKQ